jgi:hypothetical protein
MRVSLVCSVKSLVVGLAKCLRSKSRDKAESCGLTGSCGCVAENPPTLTSGQLLPGLSVMDVFLLYMAFTLCIDYSVDLK